MSDEYITTHQIYIRDEIERAVNGLIEDGYDANYLLSQSDVWLDVCVTGDYLGVSIDFDLLRMTTDYGGEVE